MPTVPGLTPDQAPSLGGTPELSVPAPVEAFGGAVGHALSGLGSQIERSSDQIWERAVQLKDLQNRSEVDKADAEYMKQAGLLHANFSALNGEQARNAFPKYIQDLQDARTNIRGGLSNAAVQRMYDSQTLNTMGRTIFNGAGHAAQQAKVAAIDSVTQRIQAQVDHAATADDPAEVEAARDKIKGLNYQKGQLEGRDSDSIDEHEKTINSSLDYNLIRHIAKTDPFKAEGILNSRKSEMSAVDYDRATDFVLGQKRMVGSVNIANAVVDSHKSADGTIDASADVLQNEARAKAAEMSPGDPIMADHAVKAVDGLYNQRKYAERSFKWDNTQTIDSKIQGGVKDLQELLADPEAQAAYYNLPKSDQLKIPSRINAYNAARDKALNEDSFTRVAGLRNNDVEAFLNLDPTDPKLNLNQSQQRAVMQWQATDKRRQNDDPRVSRALSWMRGAMGAQLQALGVYNRTKDNTEDYDHMTGTLQSALDQWQQSKGKPATYEDVVTKIAPQILQQRTVPGFFFGSTPTPFFKQDVPEEFSKRYKADFPNASDEEVYKAHNRMLLMKLYPTKSKSDGG